jgi:hypothetical protein
MKIVGFNFNKINVEKIGTSSKDVKVHTQIDVSEISEIKSNTVNTKETLLGVVFYFAVDYEPNFAKIAFTGNILVLIEPDEAKKILKQWEKKELPEEFKVNLFNIILRKSNLRALQFEEEMSIPLHMPLPSLKKKTE